MHHLLLYEYVKDIAERRTPYREEHLAKIRAGKEAGQIVMAGALGQPPTGGAFVFAEGVEPAEIEEFINADPYVQAGLVTGSRIEPWTLV